MSDATMKALLLTVGTGDAERMRETLFEPLIRSIRDGEWSRVILLPSHQTATNARNLCADLADAKIGVCPLCSPGDEENADACFAHFVEVISRLREDGFPPESIVADFTRGTKAMSAALVLAAVLHDLPRVRYLAGARRDVRGMVEPGSELVRDIRIATVDARKRLDLARRFSLRGNFAAAVELLPDCDHQLALAWPAELLEASRVLRPLVTFYAAWDRLDYASAARAKLPSAAEAPAEWKKLWPADRVRTWVAELAKPLPMEPRPTKQPVDGETARAMAECLRPLVLDLLANGERRLRDGHYEDAILRAYRVLEMIGQIRLFDHGLDSANLPAAHTAVEELQDKRRKKKEGEMPRNRLGNLMAARENVARLLKRLEDPIHEQLTGTEAKRLAKRNHSLLIHGFAAIGAEVAEELRGVYRALEKMLIADSPSAADRLAIARAADLRE